MVWSSLLLKIKTFLVSHKNKSLRINFLVKKLLTPENPLIITIVIKQKRHGTEPLIPPSITENLLTLQFDQFYAKKHHLQTHFID